MTLLPACRTATARRRATLTLPLTLAGIARSAPTSRFDSLAHGSAAGAIGHNLYPLLCVSVFEHAWLGDYGFWGKERYLQRFWDAVNWTRAEHLWGADRV